MLTTAAAVDRATSALHSIPNNVDGDTWLRASMGAKAAGVDVETWLDWCRGANNFKSESDCRTRWKSLESDGPIQAGTLFKIAAEHGWRKDNDQPAPCPTKATRATLPPRPKAAHSDNPELVWQRCTPATAGLPYATAKGASNEAMAGLGVLPAGDPLRIVGESMAGALVLPVTRADGTLSTLQLIPPPGVAARLKAEGKPCKLNLPGCPVDGWFTVGQIKPGEPTYMVEGIGAAWSVWQATGAAAVVCFGAGNMGKVAATLRKQNPTARLVLVPDVGKESDAQKIAAEHGCMVAAMPEGWPQNSDVNDLFLRDGFDVLAALLESASNAPPPPLPLSVAFADELSDTFTPPDELVQGLLTAGDGSVWYGDSNTGKTFVILDLACAVARGVPWMARQTEPGLVVYLAAESPASVRSRLQAYQKYHGVKVPNFAIVQNPLDLFDGDIDTNKLIQTIKRVEAERGQKARLIVGDTLARLSAGANENAGQDMGLVVRRIDRIRTETSAHFALIHHSGKNAANGARGWSGVRAAVDTEIELTDSMQGKCIEITKQRDIPGKGDRLGFRLEVVTLGHTKWGFPATSCVVVPTDTPSKPIKRLGEVEGAVVEFLATRKVGTKKTDVVTHFDGRYERGPIYRAIKTLVTAGVIHEAAGLVCATQGLK